jgi:hypothetical protein
LPNGIIAKLAGLVQDLNVSNFNLLNLKTLVFNALYSNGTTGGATTINWTLGSKQSIILNASATFTFTPPAGVGNLLIKITQDATGSRLVTWPASVKWAGAAAPTLSTAANATDFVSLIYDGTNYWGTYSLNFA